MRVRRLVALAAAAALLAGCGPSEAELRQQRLAEAVDASFTAPFGFRLRVAAEEDSFTGLDDAAGPVANLLATLQLEGTVGAQLAELDVDLLGARTFEVVLGEPGALLVRLDLAGLLESLGATEVVESQLVERLSAAGVDPSAVDALAASVRGEWVRIVLGGQDAGGGPVGEELAAVLRSALGTAVVTEHLGRLEGEDAFDGQLAVRVDAGRAADALSALLGGAQLPVSVPEEESGEGGLRAAVTVVGGRARTVEIDVSQLLAVDGAEVEDVRLVLEAREAGAIEEVVVPEASVVVELDALRAALAVLAPAG